MTHDETKPNKTGQLVLINHGKYIEETGYVYLPFLD